METIRRTIPDSSIPDNSIPDNSIPDNSIPDNSILDNPVWNALISGNKNLAEATGNDHVKSFPADIAPFVGLRATDADCFHALEELIPDHRVVAIVTPEEMEIPGRWKHILRTQLYQMIAPPTAADAHVADHASTPAVPHVAHHASAPASRAAAHTASPELIPLLPIHIPQMLSLTKLTNPGPFYDRTIEFGNYHGIFAGDQLIAMAGQRMHPGKYIEVSAVCTHPDHLGHGYATALILHLAALIRAQSAIPFLHVRTDNAGAIKVYKKLGFSIHQQVTISILQKLAK
jgi:predicted GNAT family acetyltransferase